MSMFTLNAVLTWLFTQQWGIEGAAFATTLTLIGLYGTGLLYIKRVIKIWPYDRRYWKLLLITGITVLALFGLQQISIPSDIIKLLLTAITAFSVFGAVLFMLKPDDEDKVMINNIREKLQSKKSLQP